MSLTQLALYMRPWINPNTKEEIHGLVKAILVRVPGVSNFVQLRGDFLAQTVKATPGAVSLAAERQLSLLAVKMDLGARHDDSIGIMRHDVERYRFVFPMLQ